MHARRPTLSLKTYRRRRSLIARRLAATIERKVPILLEGVSEAAWLTPVTPTVGRARQDAWFDWCCGCHEPDAALLIDFDAHGRRRDILFLDPGKPERVVWEGPRLTPGPEARRLFAVHDCRPRAELRHSVDDAVARAGGHIALFMRDREPRWQDSMARLWKRRLRGIVVHNAETIATPLRMIKDGEEVAWHRRAISRTRAGLLRTWGRLSSFKREGEVAGALVGAYLGGSHDPLAFASIVGCGVHAATLHYPHNDGPLRRGAPLLIDSGATAGGYCADITRTIPVGGRFPRRLRELYELVLRCNDLGRRHARPGITLPELNEIAWRPIIEAGFRRHHGLSHHIGLDVHDPADYRLPLAPGMIISNEPGIYLADEGIGIRIEDDLLITDDGCDNLSARIPRSVAAIERAIG